MQRRMIDEDSWLCQNTEMYSNGHSIYSISKLSDRDLSTWQISFGPLGVHRDIRRIEVNWSSLLIEMGRTIHKDIQLYTSLFQWKWTWMSAWVRSVCILSRMKEPLKFYVLELSNALMNNDAKLQAECHLYDWVLMGPFLYW